MTGDRSRLKVFLWLAVDNIFTIFIVGVLIAFFWRGSWELLELITRDDPVLGIWICVAVGNCGLLATCLLQEPLEKWEERLNSTSSGRVGAFIFRRIYSYIAGCCSVCQWRGLWSALDHYVGTSDISFIAFITVGKSFLLLFRSSKIISAVSFSISHDTGANFFRIQSRFQQKPSKLGLYILDHAVTMVVLWNCVFLVWRGVWGLAGIHIYADDFVKSSWTSFALGVAVLLTAIPLQILSNLLYGWMVAREVLTMWRILLEGMLLVVVNFGAIQHLRGAFFLQVIYFFPDQTNPALSPAVSHVIGFIGLVLLRVSMSNVGVGSYVTGNEPSKFGCLIDNGYFRYFLSISPYDEEDNLETPKIVSRSSSFRRNVTKSNSFRRKDGKPSTYGSFPQSSSA